MQYSCLVLIPGSNNAILDNYYAILDNYYRTITTQITMHVGNVYLLRIYALHCTALRCNALRLSKDIAENASNLARQVTSKLFEIKVVVELHAFEFTIGHELEGKIQNGSRMAAIHLTKK
jgi:hypothetical protein